GLRTITANRLRIYWRGNKGRHSTDWQTFADQLEDTSSELAQEWDRQPIVFGTVFAPSKYI
ncbi:MAG: hypothetical protein WCP23_13070, partial [Planctomycetota bacterium]